MSLSIALAQIQLPPQYHPSYAEQVKTNAAGRPVTALHIERKEKLHAISLRIGEAVVSEIMVEMRKVDAKIHADDARKLLNELVDEKRMDKRVLYSPFKRALYLARPE